MGYRNDLNNNLYTSQETIEYDFVYTTKDETINILDEIENRVNEIKQILESIKGIEIIDDAKNLLELLSRDLY